MPTKAEKREKRRRNRSKMGMSGRSIFMILRVKYGRSIRVKRNKDT